MPRDLSIAIETSSPRGSVAVGRGDQLLVTHALPDRRRHSVELMSTIDELLRNISAGPRDLAELYVSTGPGSFTGLRVAISVAQMLGETLGARLVPVATIEAAAQNVPPSDALLAVAINTKRESAYTGLFAWDGSGWVLRGEAAVRPLQAWLSELPRPLQLLGDHLPEIEADVMRGLTHLPDELAVAQAPQVWRIGRALARKGVAVDPAQLLPTYARRPEAVDLWEQRHGSA